MEANLRASILTTASGSLNLRPTSHSISLGDADSAFSLSRPTRTSAAGTSTTISGQASSANGQPGGNLYVKLVTFLIRLSSLAYMDFFAIVSDSFTLFFGSPVES